MNIAIVNKNGLRFYIVESMPQGFKDTIWINEIIAAVRNRYMDNLPIILVYMENRRILWESISHDYLPANFAKIMETIDIQRDDPDISWLPPSP
jgi:hypothetical protein